MNDTELNGIAQGIMMYLMEQCKYTADAHAVIVCLCLLYYQRAIKPDVVYPIEEFAKDMSDTMVQFWNNKIQHPQGSDTIQ